MRAAGASAPGAAQRVLQLPAATRIAMLLAAAALGVTVASLPVLALALLLAAPVLLLVVRRPEWILILFLTAGIYKQDPRLARVLPLDVTMVTGGLLAVAVVIRVARRPLHVPAAALALLPLVAAVGLGLVSGAGEYGADKAMRFCTLTVLAIVAGCVLLEDRPSLVRFLWGLAVLGFLLSLDATQAEQTTSEGRLTAHGSSPIALARIGALTLAFGWVRFHFARRPFDKLACLGVLAVSCLCVLAAGSRGPLLSIVGGMMLISVVSAAHHGRSPLSMTSILIVVGLGAAAVSLAAIPSLPLHRFQLLVSEDKGTSILLRGMMFATAWKLTLTHPLGIGVGGFERYALLDLKYPHNLFLEVGCELGWIPLLALVGLIAWSLHTLFEVLRREYRWTSMFLALVVLTSFTNSMVTGDLNDNRLFFAVILLPFIYRRQMGLEAGTPRRGAARGLGGGAAGGGAAGPAAGV
jgi:hypothetical protein